MVLDHAADKCFDLVLLCDIAAHANDFRLVPLDFSRRRLTDIGRVNGLRSCSREALDSCGTNTGSTALQSDLLITKDIPVMIPMVPARRVVLVRAAISECNMENYADESEVICQALQRIYRKRDGSRNGWRHCMTWEALDMVFYAMRTRICMGWSYDDTMANVEAIGVSCGRDGGGHMPL